MFEKKTHIISISSHYLRENHSCEPGQTIKKVKCPKEEKLLQLVYAMNHSLAQSIVDWHGLEYFP
jgi:hypothetical protein